MMTLYGYWRSTASYRVRIALGLKRLDYRYVGVDLRTGAQRRDDFLALFPQGLVPVLEAEGVRLSQSMAIMEWLNERWPEPALLPGDLADRAMVRSMAQTIACDIHPLHNLRVLSALRREFGADEAQVNRWIGRWIGDGLAALEILVERHGGRHAFGDTPGLADCCLIPQLYAADRFNVAVDAFPNILRVAANAIALPEVARAHPSVQPDADRL